MFYILQNSQGLIFSGLYPPKYQPRFVKPEGSFNCTIFTSKKDCEEIIASFNLDAEIVQLNKG